jgi:hypothetical protein
MSDLRKQREETHRAAQEARNNGIYSEKKKTIVEKLDLYEIYVKDASGSGISKQLEIKGTRAEQVEARRSIRAKLNLSADRIILYRNGQFYKCGIDKTTA